MGQEEREKNVKKETASIRFGILSGPDAFDGFIFVNSFSMMIGLMLFFDCILVDGRSLFVGLVKTD
jgi:hypothetical protein